VESTHLHESSKRLTDDFPDKGYHRDKNEKQEQTERADKECQDSGNPDTKRHEDEKTKRK
jgi:hypothetical protein